MVFILNTQVQIRSSGVCQGMGLETGRRENPTHLQHRGHSFPRGPHLPQGSSLHPASFKGIERASSLPLLLMVPPSVWDPSPTSIFLLPKVPRLWTGSAWDALLAAHSIWTTHLHSSQQEVLGIPRLPAQLWSCSASKNPNIPSGLQVALLSQSDWGPGSGRIYTNKIQCSPGVPCGWAQGLALQSLSVCTTPTEEDPLLFFYLLQLLPLSSGLLAPPQSIFGAWMPQVEPTVMGL